MKTFISTILLCLFMMSPALAQSVEMADVMRSNGKIYVVVAVIAIIFIGLMVYLVCMDKRVKKLEEK
jgi:CcmD family protein